MSIFNEVRVSERNPNYGVDGPEWLASTVHTDLNRLMIRTNHNGHVLVAERPEDEYSDDPYFQWSGWVFGALDVDEYGIIFEGVTSKVGGKLNRVVVTRKGVYGG